jgi:tetratricopeptide (TPR) repeat protein
MEEAIKEHELAKELDPLNPLHTAWLGALYGMEGRHEEAIKEARRALELNPDFPVGWSVLGSTYREMGMYEEAIAAHQKLAEITADKSDLGATYFQVGRRDEAMKILAELEEQEPTPSLALTLAGAYANLGRKDEAFQWLNYYEHPHAFFPWIVKGLISGPLRDDPRSKDLLRRLNFPDLE